MTEPTKEALETAFMDWFHDAFFDGEETDDAKAARALADIAWKMAEAFAALRVAEAIASLVCPDCGGTGFNALREPRR